MSLRAALALTALVASLLAVRLLRMDPGRYSTDAIYYLAVAEHASVHPAEVLKPDYIGRRHPLFLAVLALVERLLGPSLVALAVLVYAGHLASCLLLGRLVARLGVPAPGPSLAAFLLAVFPGANNLFADPFHFGRSWNLALALAALVALLAGRSWTYVALYAATLLNFEDAVLLPLAALAVERMAPSGSARRVPAVVHVVALTLLGGAMALWATAPRSAHPVALGTHVIVKAALLPVEVARASLVLRSDVVPPLAPRLALAVIAVALLVPRPREVRLARGALASLLALAAAFSAPYLARPTEGAWPSRYLYFPAAALLAIAGSLAASTPARRRLPGLAILAIVGLTTTERAAEAIAERHLHRFTSATPLDIVRAAAGRLEPTTCPPPDPVWLGAEDCAFLARAHLPFHCQDPPPASPGSPIR